jgi:hypothetical protein
MLNKLICGLVALSFGFSLLGADNPFVGTWKLNQAKSKFAKGHEIKDATIVIAVEGDTASVSVNRTTSDGQTFSAKYTVPTAGGPINYTEIAPPRPAGNDGLKKIDDHTYEFTSTMNGKEILKQHIAVSADDKTMVIRESGVDEKGRAFKAVYVHDRQ